MDRKLNLRVSGVGCQVSGKKNKKTETCWSEAEIPSEAKRQRGTLKPETSIFSSTLQALFELADYKSTQIGKICLS